ncbi:hypothetical protein M8R20_10300 [Pseudomonas sp. R2.Fl]|nr:hypothetical protein [Pseudomonas sp. R2.Fl]
MRGSVASVLALTSGGFVPALAADCPVERAVYAEAELSTELRFEPASAENSPVTHRFTMVASGKAGEAEGHVFYDLEIERPVSTILRDCPEGDVTGADLAACTVWKGIIYGVDQATGHVDLLPPEGAAAPDQLLLPGFGPAVAASSLGQAFDGMPWDVFSYKECAPKG